MKKYLLSFFFVSFFFSCVSPAFAAITGLNDIAYSLLFGSRRDGEDNLYNDDADAICKSQGAGYYRVKPDPNLSCQSKTVSILIKKTDDNGNETTSEGPDKTTCYYNCICDSSKFPYKEADVNDNIYFKVADGAKKCKTPGGEISVSDIECDPTNATASISVYDDFFNTTNSDVTFEGASKSKTCYAFDKFECRYTPMDVAKLTPVNNLALNTSGGTRGLFTIDDDPLLQYEVALSRSYNILKGGAPGVACAYGAKIPNKISIPDGWGGSKQVQNSAFITGNATKKCASAETETAKYLPSFSYSFYNGDCMTDRAGCGSDNMANTNITAENFTAYYKSSGTISEESCPMEAGCKTTSAANGGYICPIGTAWGEWMDTVTPTGAGCQALPTCDEFGYVFTKAQCEQFGLDYIHCPMDSTKVYCSMVKVPDNCEVGMIYNTSNNTCYEGTSGRIVTNVEEKNGLKYITTVNSSDPREVLKDAAIEVDSGSRTFPVLNINTSTIQNGVELRIAAENFCYNGGYDKGLPSGKDMIEVYKKVGELGNYYGNGGTKCKQVGCDYMFLTSEGYVYGDVPVTEDNITSEKYQRSVSNYMMLCKKTYPMRVYTEPSCVAKGYETTIPEGQTCKKVGLVDGPTCYTECRAKTCADTKGQDGVAGVTERPDGQHCTQTTVGGVYCYTDCYKRLCSEIDDNYVDNPDFDEVDCASTSHPDGGVGQCYYNCVAKSELEPEPEPEDSCRADTYYNAGTECSDVYDGHKYYVLAAEKITNGKKLTVIDIEGAQHVSAVTARNNQIHSGTMATIYSGCYDVHNLPSQNEYLRAFSHNSKYKETNCYLTSEGYILRGTTRYGTTDTPPGFGTCPKQGDTTVEQLNAWCKNPKPINVMNCSEGMYFYDGRCDTTKGRYYILDITPVSNGNKFTLADLSSTQVKYDETLTIIISQAKTMCNNAIPSYSDYKKMVEAGVISDGCYIAEDGIYVDGKHKTNHYASDAGYDVFREYWGAGNSCLYESQKMLNAKVMCNITQTVNQ